MTGIFFIVFCPFLVFLLAYTFTSPYDPPEGEVSKNLLLKDIYVVKKPTTYIFRMFYCSQEAAKTFYFISYWYFIIIIYRTIKTKKKKIF